MRRQDAARARLARLSRVISHALRHRPERYGTELDPEGWVEVEALRSTLAREPEWADLKLEDISAMLAASQKRRFEKRGALIRALYGHSLAAAIERAPAIPPNHLYHGTAPGALPRIHEEGLKPMRRQHVHLSGDIETAAAVARRRTQTPVILCANAQAAYRDGIRFYRGNESVWLADSIPGRYLSVLELGEAL